jgi:hypothetical protein
LGIGVMLIRRTTFPSRSYTTVPAGMRTSNPGIVGVEITVSCVVGDEIGTALAQSIFGIHTV